MQRYVYAIRCRYRPGGATDRLPIRVTHLRYMIAQLPITVFGGAVLSETGEPLGMEVVIDVPTRNAAEAFIRDEPYAAAGLFASIEISRIRQMVPPLNGATLSHELELELAHAAAPAPRNP